MGGGDALHIPADFWDRADVLDALDQPAPEAPANRPPAPQPAATRTGSAQTPAARGRATPTRSERARRTNLLRPSGLTWDQIAAVWITDRPDITPRVAFRWAHNLSHQDVAEQWNSLDPGQPTQTKARIFEYEAWPKGGRRPSVNNLDMLARIYQTTGRNLLTENEFGHYDHTARADINNIDHRHLDHNQPTQPTPNEQATPPAPGPAPKTEPEPESAGDTESVTDFSHRPPNAP